MHHKFALYYSSCKLLMMMTNKKCLMGSHMQAVLCSMQCVVHSAYIFYFALLFIILYYHSCKHSLLFSLYIMLYIILYTSLQRTTTRRGSRRRIRDTSEAGRGAFHQNIIFLFNCFFSIIVYHYHYYIKQQNYDSFLAKFSIIVILLTQFFTEMRLQNTRNKRNNLNNHHATLEIHNSKRF